MYLILSKGEVMWSFTFVHIALKHKPTHFFPLQTRLGGWGRKWSDSKERMKEWQQVVKVRKDSAGKQKEKGKIGPREEKISEIEILTSLFLDSECSVAAKSEGSEGERVQKSKIDWDIEEGKRDLGLFPKCD